MRFAIDARYGPLEADISERENIRLPKDHNPKDGNRPRANPFDSSERVFPSQSAFHPEENYVGIPNDLNAALCSPSWYTERSKEHCIRGIRGRRIDEIWKGFQCPPSYASRDYC